MGRRCREAVRIELRTDLLCRPAEVAGELHFLVPDARHLRERLLQVFPHRGADGV